MISISPSIEFIIQKGMDAKKRRGHCQSNLDFSLTANRPTSGNTSALDNRRYTVSAPAFQRTRQPQMSIQEYPISADAAKDGLLTPKLSGSHIACVSVSSGVSRTCNHRQSIVSRTTSPIQAADIADKDALFMGQWDEPSKASVKEDEQVLLLTPLSPPMTPRQSSADANAPVPSIMSLPNLSLSAFGFPPSSSLPLRSDSDTALAPKRMSTPAAPESLNSSITCLVLDNKKVHLARPRLVQISPSPKK